MKYVLNKLQAVLLFAVGVVGAFVAAAHQAPNMSLIIFVSSIALALISITVNAD